MTSSDLIARERGALAEVVARSLEIVHSFAPATCQIHRHVMQFWCCGWTQHMACLYIIVCCVSIYIIYIIHYMMSHYAVHVEHFGS